jgi:Tfp pilus assembly protein PilN
MNSPNELSFLPDDYLERRARRRTNAICAILFIVVMVAISAAFKITERSSRDVEAQYDAKLREYTDAARQIEQADKMKEKQRKMAHQAEIASSLLEKVPRSFILAELTNSLPAGASLLDLVMTSRARQAQNTAPLQARTAVERRKANEDAAKKAQELVQIQQFDVQLKITGIAGTDVQVAQFISKLNTSRLLKDVNLVISDQFEKDKEILRKFVIEATLDPKAEVRPGETARRSNTTAAQLPDKSASAGE